jgi:hypothetical protein
LAHFIDFDVNTLMFTTCYKKRGTRHTKTCKNKTTAARSDKKPQTKRGAKKQQQQQAQ